jgi:hypothetical protein
MKYEIRVSKDGVVSSFQADMRSGRAGAMLDSARAILEERGLSEVLLSVRSVQQVPDKKKA